MLRLLLVLCLLLPPLPSQPRRVDVTFLGEHDRGDGKMLPMKGGNVWWLDRAQKRGVHGILDENGLYKVAMPYGAIIPWHMTPPDDDTCTVVTPPTEHGPGDMGVFLPLTMTQYIIVQYAGQCEP